MARIWAPLHPYVCIKLLQVNIFTVRPLSLIHEFEQEVCRTWSLDTSSWFFGDFLSNILALLGTFWRFLIEICNLFIYKYIHILALSPYKCWSGFPMVHWMIPFYTHNVQLYVQHLTCYKVHDAVLLFLIHVSIIYMLCWKFFKASWRSLDRFVTPLDFSRLLACSWLIYFLQESDSLLKNHQ